MFGGEMQEVVDQSLREFLVWVGFGTLAGLAAKGLMPGRDPGGAVTTLLMGIGGTVIGCALVLYFTDGQHVSPITGLGFFAAVIGSFILLFFYRLMSGSFFVEAEDGDRIVYRRTRGRSRRRREYIEG